MLLGLLLTSLALGTVSRPALSQGNEWGAEENDERRREIVRRYRSLLERRPVEGMILDRLLDEVGGGRAFEALVEEYESRVEADPADFAAVMILAHLYKHANLLDEAVRLYEMAAALRPESPWPLQSMAEGLFGGGRRAEAKDAYARALEVTRDSDERERILFSLADIAFSERNFEEAIAFLAQIVAADPNDVYMRMQLADVLIEYGQLEAALEQYWAIVEQSSRDTRRRAVTLGMIGDVLLELDRVSEAIDTYREAQGYARRGSWLSTDLERRIIDAHRTTGDLVALVEHYESEWRRPDYAQLRILAELYAELGRDLDAEDALRQAIRKNRRGLDARLDLVALLERRGDLDAAVGEYEEVLRYSDEVIYRIRLAQLQRRAGDEDSALGTLRRAERTFRNSVGALMQLAELYLRWGERGLAVTVYERLVAIDPDSADHHIALGDIYFMESRWDEAVAAWRRLLDVIPDANEARITLARVFTAHHMVDEAVRLLDDVLSGSETNIAALRTMAEILEEARRFTAAISFWEQLAEQSSDELDRLESRGRIIDIYSRQGVLMDRLSNLVSDWQDGLGTPHSGHFLAEAYLALGRYPDAELVLLRLLEEDDQNIEVLSALAHAYDAQQRIDEALDVYRQIARIDPLNRDVAFEHIVDLALRSFDEETAIEYAMLALRENPHDPRVHAALGAIYHRLGDLAQAAAAYDEAVRLDGRAYRFVFELAGVYAALGQLEEAAALYGQVVARSRDRATLKRAGHRAITTHARLGTLDLLLAEWEALLGRPNFESESRELCLRLLQHMAAPLLAEARGVGGSRRSSAEDQLERLGARSTHILQVGLGDADSNIRMLAIQLSADLGRTETSAAIARTASDPSDDVRQQAAVALGRLRADGTGDTLRSLVADSSPRVRAAAVWALGRIADPLAVPQLARLADSDSEPAVASLATLSLGWIDLAHPDGAISRQLASLAQSSDALRRRAAVIAMGVSACPDLRTAIEAALVDDETTIRSAAAWALGRLSMEPGTIERLLEHYWTDSPEVRLSSAYSLRWLSTGRTAPRPSLAWTEPPAFSTTGPIDVSAYLGQLLPDPLVPFPPTDSGLVADHATALGNTYENVLSSGDRRSRSRMISDLTEDPFALGLGLVSLGGADAIGDGARLADTLSAREPALSAALSTETGIVRDAASVLAFRLGQSSREEFAALNEGTGAMNRAINRLVVVSQAAARTTPSDELVEAYESAPFPSVGGAAARRALMAAPRSWAQVLRALSESSSDTMRVELARALATEGGASAQGALEDLKGDPSPAVRRAVLP